jgi:phosphoglucosamine mutase
MGKQLFGTDGIRGVAGEYPLDPATVHAFGMALGADLRRGAADATVLIGMDTRESGPWIAAQVAGGLAQQGVRAVSAGVITTPGVAWLTRSDSFAAGVMISASHNPYQDNGIKVFGPSGYKLPDDEEHEIEQEIFRHAGEKAGTPLPLEPDSILADRYLDFLASTVTGTFAGMRLVLDCGNGAAYQLGPALFRRLGAEVEAICCEPNGRNINLDCGALHVEWLRGAVAGSGAAMGVAFDGDADRAIFVAHSGAVVDGDAVLLIAARALKAADKLDGDLVVATVMSNLGLERALERNGTKLLRTPVGDKYVLEEMVRTGAVLGGEQSGHVIFRQFATTGDGLLTALRVLEIARNAGAGLDELTAGLEIYPQRLVNVRVRERKALHELAAVAREIEDCQQAFGASGRVLVRFSGTEPLARVMVEGPDTARVDDFTNRIATAIRNEIGA